MALCLPLGCMNDPQYAQVPQITKRLEGMQIQSQILEEQALGVESQIDEVRRANTENKSTEIETLRVQFNALKETHESLKLEMSALRVQIRQTTPQR